MSNSKLVNYVKISPHKTSPRRDKIRKITIHHMAGKLSVEECGEVFQSRDASANYGIDNEGNVGLYVEEADRAWSTENGDNDHQAVNIELANDQVGGDWHVSDAVIQKCILLCADICKRNGLPGLKFTGTSDGTLTQHCYFAATACPGPYLKTKFQYIADEVNKLLKDGLPTDGDDKPQQTPQPAPSDKKSVDEIAREVIAGEWGNGDEREERLTAAGYDYDEVQERVNEILLGDMDDEPTPEPEPPKPDEVKASQPAMGYDASISRAYKVTAGAGLNVRDGAGTDYKVLTAIPYGFTVQNYGYYTDRDGTRWLYVAFEQDGIRYTGFASQAWLS